MISCPNGITALSHLHKLFNSHSLGSDLPYNNDPDEPYWYAWTQYLRAGGVSHLQEGSGYPPGILVLLAVEQWAVELLRGEAINAGVDYFIVGRLVSVLLGIGSIVLAAGLARTISDSHLTGLIAGLLVASGHGMVAESRRAGANSPWLFFTLLSLVFLLQAYKQHRLSYLTFALLSGAASFLFKYQSGVIMGLPFLFAILYFRDMGKGLLKPLFWWSLVLSLGMLWMIFQYQIMDIVNVPESDTATYINESGQFLGMRSIQANWEYVENSFIHENAFNLTVAFIIFSVLLKVVDGKKWAMNLAGVLALTLFAVTFYLVMSFFRPAATSKWLVFNAALHILFTIGLVTFATLIGKQVERLGTQALPKPEIFGAITTLALIGFVSWPYLNQAWVDWRTTLNDWSKPVSEIVMAQWFAENVPQGGRVVAEATKILHNNATGPRIYHVFTVDSIFDEPIASYRERRYEFLVWNNKKSNATDQLENLDTPEHQDYLSEAREVFRLTGAAYTGPEIVLFAIQPRPEHQQYAWLAEQTLSFRGYDLSAAELAPGEDLQLRLYWMSAQITSADLIGFVHLWDPSAEILVAQTDNVPGNRFNNTWKWLGDMQFHIDDRQLEIPGATPAGEYELRIGMYAAGSNKRVPIQVVGETAPVANGSLLLQTVTITTP